MNKMLLSYFILMKPELPPTVNPYEIRRPKFRVPFIKHVFNDNNNNNNNNNLYYINYSQRLTLYSTYNKMLWPKCKQAKYAR